MISTHVDDIFAAGDGSAVYRAAIKKLQETFLFGEWKSLYDSISKFCGSAVRERKDFSIEVSQESFCSGLTATNIRGLSNNP